MSAPKAVAAFLADCWRADSRGGQVVDLLGSGVEHLRLLERDPFLGFANLRLGVAADDPLVVAAELTRREKAPFLFATVLVGRAAVGRRRQKIVAPLLSWPAAVARTETGNEVVAESEIPQINAAALADLLGEESLGQELAAEISRRLPPLPWGAGGGFALGTLIAELLPQVELAGIDGFPDHLANRRTLEAAARSGTTRLVGVIGVGLTRRSVETRGIDDELRQLVDGATLSAPVSMILGGPAVAPGRSSRSRRSPAVLSRPQIRALEIASTQPLGLLVGPPGTGKSFSIAAIALDAVARGESVLIASGREQAVKVVEDKCRELAGDWLVAVRAGRGEVQRELTAGLDALLHGDLGALGPPSAISARRLERRVRAAERRADRLERRLRQQLALETGARSGPNWIAQFERWWCRLRTAGAPPLWVGFGEWERELQGLGTTVAEWVRVARRERVEKMLAKRREVLVALRRAIGARRSGDQERWFASLDQDVVRAAFPLWSTTFADAYRAMPFEPEFFDLVIVDEATQCDSASALPILQRGRRALVTGDPQQLRHVSFLADLVQGQLAERHGLDSPSRERFDYRRRSLLDLVADALPSSLAIARLDEHFRSAPAIIEFSNREFYGEALAVMTSRPSVLARPALAAHLVQGRRGEDGVNAAEVEVVLERVGIFMAEAAARGTAPPTIGMVTPFRAQADALAEACGRHFSSSQVAAHDLLVGTVWGFQGEERDIVVLSLALDAASAAGAWRYLNRADLFNVAITRARRFQLVVTSVEPHQAPAGSLSARYLEGLGAASEVGVGAVSSGRVGSEFGAAVAGACRERGWEVWPGFEVAGTRVDLLVASGSQELAVDLVGGSGPDAEAVEIERARMVGRAGLRLFPLPWSQWQRDPAEVLAALARELEPTPRQ